MNGLEQILLKIEEDAKNETEKINNRAESSANEYIEKAVQSANSDAEVIIAAAKKKSALIIESAKSGGDAFIKRSELAAKTKIINESLDFALKSIEELETEKYFDIIYKLILKYAHKEHGKLFMNSRDLQRLPADFIKKVNNALEKYKSSIELSEVPAKIRSGLIISYGGIEENCAFDELLNEKSDLIKDRLFALLKDAQEGNT